MLQQRLNSLHHCSCICHYCRASVPMESEAAVPAGGGAAEHVDKGLLTMIAEDAAQGLQVAIAHNFEFDAF